MALSAKQRAFIDEYLQCWNASEAARRAGYSERSAGAIGHENLKKPEIKAEIERRVADLAMSADEALIRLGEIGRADIGAWLTDDGYIDIAAMKAARATAMIRKVKRKERTGTTDAGVAWHEVDTEIELHDAKDAQKFIVTQAQRGPSGEEDDPIHSIEWSPEEWKAERAKRLKDAAATMQDFADDDADPQAAGNE